MPVRPSRRLLVPLVLLALAVAACAPDPEPSAPAASADRAPERPRWVENAVIYEVFVRSFTPEGTFRAMIPRLGELKALGVTTLWLMPIHPVGEANRKGRLGSPYAVRDYRGIDPAYGTAEDFQALVDAVHDREMTLILDFVANHTAWDHPWVAAHPEFYTRGPDGAVPVAPEGTDWTDVADLDYANAALRDSMAAAMAYWVETFGVDGFRCDVAALVPADFWQAAIPRLRALKPVMMLAEAEEPWLHEAGFDLTYGWNTYNALKAVWGGQPADSLYAALAREEGAYPPGALRLRFITNHDETSWDAAAVRRYGGVDGTRAAMTVAATIPGVPLVYNGQEVASPRRLNLFENEEIDWKANPELREFYRGLLALTTSSRALRRGSFEPIAHEADADVLLYAREHETERVVVAVNTRGAERTLRLPAAALGEAMRDVFTNEAPPDSALTLGPYGLRVYRGLAAR